MRLPAMRSLLCGVVVLVTACGEPAIDGSSGDSYERTLERVRDRLRAEDRERLDAALDAIRAGWWERRRIDLDLDHLNDVDQDEWTRSIVHGLTFRDVIGEGSRISECRLDLEEADLLEIIENMEAVQSDIRELAAVRTLRGSWRPIPRPGGGEPLLFAVDLMFRNELEWTASSLTFELRLWSPERKLYWGTETATWQIPGGIQPGEERLYQTQVLGSLRDGFLAAGTDAALTAVVVGAVDAMGNRVGSASGLPIRHFEDRAEQARVRLEGLRQGLSREDGAR
jgi:hypothetical protein